MLPKAIATSTNLLAEAGARCAWKQWSAIGALTLHAPKADDEIVDIEALLLGSLGLAERVPRLRTLVDDWTVENSRLISIARVRALLTGSFAKANVDIGPLAQLAATRGGDARWRAFLPQQPTHDAATSRVQAPRSKASPPRWRGSHTLLLQLRRGIGHGVKSDLLAILLGQSGRWVDAATLAELSAYTVAAVRRAADDLVSAGFIESSGGHGKDYRAEITAWKSLLSTVETPTWRRRADGFAFVLGWLDSVARQAKPDASEFTYAVSFGQAMTDSWPLWLEAGVTREPVSDSPASAWSSRHAAIESLVRWFGADE